MKFKKAVPSALGLILFWYTPLRPHVWCDFMLDFNLEIPLFSSFFFNGKI